jgi:2-polyprenyl-6-methoxyphenol hydroxylase-like FAD-dependent oxidoreductase
VHDVLVIGAGQAGLALSMALQQVGIKPVLLDRSAPDFEGPGPPRRAWKPCARPRS